tara:strand:- start:590 stop:730 length:141 start_codon:yes stop_codon:yes gene_type:complete
MTKFEFMALCGELTLDPLIVLQDSKVRDLLTMRKNKELREYLESKY